MVSPWQEPRWGTATAPVPCSGTERFQVVGSDAAGICGQGGTGGAHIRAGWFFKPQGLVVNELTQSRLGHRRLYCWLPDRFPIELEQYHPVGIPDTWLCVFWGMGSMSSSGSTVCGVELLGGACILRFQFPTMRKAATAM